MIGFILLELRRFVNPFVESGRFFKQGGAAQVGKARGLGVGGAHHAPQGVGAVEHQKPSVLSPAGHDPHMGQVGIEGQIAGEGDVYKRQPLRPSAAKQPAGDEPRK